MAPTAVTEGNFGTKDLTFTVSLSGYSPSNVTVSYATVDATATAPNDYTPASGKLTFAPGEQTKTMRVKVNGDTRGEPDEKLVLKLSGPTGASVSVAKAAVASSTTLASSSWFRVRNETG